MTADSLNEYRKKRDFKITAEPRGRKARSKGKPRFVVQKHAARTLHYDFRLEVGGVLKSWAVPKGPSTDPKVKRLAIRTEDHPLAYAGFEGVIPAGEYGAGKVIVWDAGTYRNLADHNGKKTSLKTQLDRGHVAVWLAGRKLRGGYALSRIGPGRKERWLLVKMRDGEADARRNPARNEPESVRSGRTVEEVGERKKPAEKPRSRKKRSGAGGEKRSGAKKR